MRTEINKTSTSEARVSLEATTSAGAPEHASRERRTPGQLQLPFATEKVQSVASNLRTDSTCS